MLTVLQTTSVGLVPAGPRGAAGTSNVDPILSPDATDLNTLLVQGNYFVTNPTNGPEAGATKRWRVSVMPDASVVPLGIIQEASLIKNGTQVVKYIRRRPTGAAGFDAWKQFLVEGSLAVPVVPIDTTFAADGKILAWDSVSSKFKPVYASPAAAVADLRDFMNIHYGDFSTGAWTGRTATGVGTDIGPAMDAAFDALRTRYGRGRLFVPPPDTNLWRMATPPTPAKMAGHQLEGVGSQGTKIVVDMASGVAFQWTGAGGFSGGGMIGFALLLENGKGATTTYMIQLMGNSSFQPDKTLFKDIYQGSLDGASSWYQGVNVDGTAADGTGPTAHVGVREFRMEALDLFFNRNCAAFFSNAIQSCIDQFSSSIGVGGTGNDINFDGQGATTMNDECAVTNMICGGTFFLRNTIKSRIEGFTANADVRSTADFIDGSLKYSGTFVGGGFGGHGTLSVYT